MYQAELNSSDTETTVTLLDADADHLHVVETGTLPLVREPLKIMDFGFVNQELETPEREGLLELLNEYRDCFVKDLSELECTPLMTVSIRELPNSNPVVCQPYKTTASDCAEIARIVVDWK